jgi:hypothetical protein
MAAVHRCSGDVRMSIKLNSGTRRPSYSVEMHTPSSTRRCVLRHVRLSPYEQGRLGADSASAYNRIAEAAIAFADGLSRKSGGCPDLEAGAYARGSEASKTWDKYVIHKCPRSKR